MKILHIIDTLWLGGAQSVVKTFFEKETDNKDIFLYVLRQTEPQITIHHENIIVHKSGSRYSLAPIAELKNIIMGKRIDILHCHLPRAQVFGYILKRFYFPKIKLVFHEQGIIYDHPVVLPFLFNVFKKRIDAFIVCSENNKQELLKKVKNIEGKTFFLPNFVNTELHKAVQKIDKKGCRIKLGIDPNAFVIGFAGRLVQRKGWEELIEAAAVLKKEDNIHFVISGIGPEQNMMLEMIAKNGLGKKITYLGYVSDMVPFYAAIDCLILPSHWEGMSLSQQEAIAAGLPVLISESINDTTQGVFITFKNKDPKDMASKIMQQRLRNSEGKMGLNEQLHAVLVKNEELFMSGLEEVYKSI
ncbi:MAG TPA: glycosyltransferase family 4 protein [Bacteroidia bacterium]|jgi:glycosyltransferase involved in cell wall biosynthesis|nr:glycosyltransferase family 4 protein [Bacteroidia bacterium]